MHISGNMFFIHVQPKNTPKLIRVQVVVYVLGVCPSKMSVSWPVLEVCMHWIFTTRLGQRYTMSGPAWSVLIYKFLIQPGPAHYRQSPPWPGLVLLNFWNFGTFVYRTTLNFIAQSSVPVRQVPCPILQHGTDCLSTCTPCNLNYRAVNWFQQLATS